MNQSAIVFLFFAFVLIYGQENITSSCGQRIDIKPRIINGYAASYWPWHAAIYHKENGDFAYKCGGTLISSNLILTAAHCVMISREKVLVSLGRLNVSLNANETSSQSFNISEIKVHLNYTREDQRNDIAIIKLSRNVTFTYHVQPVCILSKKTDIPEIHGKDGIVIGWGRTENGELSEELLQAHMPIVNFSECLPSNRALYGSYLSGQNFCAGSRNGTGICDGDSGGSMTFKNENGMYYIRGIVSVLAMEKITDMESTCDPRQYAIFTDVAEYLPWIHTLIHECQKKVQCKFTYFGKDLECETPLDIKRSEPKCNIIFDESINASVTTLTIIGKSEVLPGLSDTIDKFDNLITLNLRRLSLQIVENDNFAPFNRIKSLNLQQNNISDLASNTFDSLSDLTQLALDYNTLNTIHRDLFQKLHNLTKLALNNNQLKELPKDLFRNNQKLEFLFCYDNQIFELHRDVFLNLINLKELYLHKNNLIILEEGLFRNNPSLNTINLQFNQIRHIRCDFYDLPVLNNIDFRDNLCIDEDCIVKSFCGTTSIIQMQRKIWNKCPF